MYSKEFCDIYNEYGWDYFSLTMGDAILKYLNKNNIKIKQHLDLGCGVGTLCDYFFKNGIKTTGLDISPDMINICKNRNENIAFFVEDMTQYISNEKYDLITITCDAINHILEEKKFDRIISNVSKMLNTSGYLIFDIIDKDKLILNSNIISNRSEDIKVYYYITNKGELINTNIKVIQNNEKIYECDVLEKLYTIEFIKKILLKYNLEILKSENSILNEKQRIEDKIYFICKRK